MKKKGLTNSQKITIGFWSYLIAFLIPFLLGFLMGYGFQVPSLIQLSLIFIAYILLSVNLWYGFVTIANIFKKQFLKKFSYFYAGVYIFFASFLIGLSFAIGIENFSLTSINLNPSYVFVFIVLNFIDIIFGISLLSLKDIFKRLSYIASFSIILYDLVAIIMFISGFVILSVINVFLSFIIIISVLLILHKSMKKR